MGENIVRLDILDFNLKTSCSSSKEKPLIIGNLLTIPVAEQDVSCPINFMDAVGKTSHKLTGFSFYGWFTSNTTALGTINYDEMAVFTADNIINFTGQEFGFRLDMKTNILYGYVQEGTGQPAGVTQFLNVILDNNPDGKRHYYIAKTDGKNFYYYIDDIFNGSISIVSTKDYSNINYYLVATTHRQETGWLSNGSRLVIEGIFQSGNLGKGEKEMDECDSIPISRPYILPLRHGSFKGLFFNGINANVTVPYNASLAFTTQLSMLVRFEVIADQALQTNDFPFLVSKVQPVLGLRQGWNLLISRLDDMKVKFENWLNGAQNIQFFSTSKIKNINHIYTACFSYNSGGAGNNLLHNIDGLQDATTADADNLVNDITTGISIGSRFDGALWYYGIIYEVMLINGQLDNNQFFDLYSGRHLPTEYDCRLWHDYRLGHSRDLSGNNNDGTVNNALFI